MYANQRCITNFNTQITTRNHYRIACHDNAIKCFIISYRFCTLNLGYQTGATASPITGMPTDAADIHQALKAVAPIG